MMGIKFLLGITLVLVVSLGGGEACMADAAMGAGLPGGWFPVSLSGTSDSADGQDETKLLMDAFAQKALKDWTSKVDSLGTKYSVDKVSEAYSQVVAGTNYCLGFTAKAKNCGENDVLQGCSQGLKCEAKVYVGLTLVMGSPTTEVTNVVCVEKV